MPPMFINVGAYIGEQTMVDSHALVGSCAQVGKRVHLSAAAQVGGVLEPVGALAGDEDAARGEGGEVVDLEIEAIADQKLTGGEIDLADPAIEPADHRILAGNGERSRVGPDAPGL